MIKKIENEMVKILTEAYQPTILEIENESDKHAGPEGRESHFKVLIVSDLFKPMKRIDRQKHVYQTLKDIMPRIHALALKTLDLDQFSEIKSDDKTSKAETNKDSAALEAAKRFISPDCTHDSVKKKSKSKKINLK